MGDSLTFPLVPQVVKVCTFFSQTFAQIHRIWFPDDESPDLDCSVMIIDIEHQQLWT